MPDGTAPADPRHAAFVAWVGQRPDDTSTVTAFGSDWAIPARMPARLWFWWRALVAQGRDLKSITNDELAELIELTIPAEHLDVWLSWGVAMNELANVAGNVLGQYLYGHPKAGDASGEASTSTSSSSNTSESSQPTSGESTGSTSEPPSPED